MLLHEVDHRVKNNLTMIGSLLRLQARTIKEPDTAAKLQAMLERVDALATVHRRLYQSNDITHFDLGAFAENLLSDVLGASGRDDLALETDIEAVEIPSSAAAPMGLVLNELLTNAIKHAYSNGRQGKLTVKVKRKSDDVIVRVQDDGPGLPDGQAPSGGLGTAVVERLAKQLHATVTWADARPGTLATVVARIDAL
ncbi:sensor histidine kinase [Novosphingobium sp. JCM 18896]|nr:sensor histidine kinase [Novosphingobium sp. JCM 18896]